MGEARLARFEASFVLLAGERNASILEGGIGSDWASDKALLVLGCDLLASEWGLEVGFVRSRGGVASGAVVITELVIVEAMRTSASGGEAMGQLLDGMSGGEKIENSGRGNHEFARKMTLAYKGQQPPT